MGKLFMMGVSYKRKDTAARGSGDQLKDSVPVAQFPCHY